MNEHIQATHALLLEKRDQINAAIAGLELLLGAPPGDVERKSPKKAVPRKKAARNADRAVTQNPSAPASPDIVQARDTSILKALKHGPAAKADLIEAMPPEPGKTAEQRSRDCGNALTRLRLKRLIKQVDEGWALA